jgi:hypothetical protein
MGGQKNKRSGQRRRQPQAGNAAAAPVPAKPIAKPIPLPEAAKEPLIPAFLKNPTGIIGIIGFIVWLANLHFNVISLKESQSQFEARSEGHEQKTGAELEEMKADLQTVLTEGAVTSRRFRDGILEKTDHRRQFQFMTPSSETWQFKKDSYGESDPEGLERFDWQKGITEKKVEEFGSRMIRNSFTRGWRRYPFSGQGQYRDAGWWWVITVDDSFDLDRFVKFYTEFWGAKEVYVEELNARGTVMPDAIIPNPDIPPVTK